jgi:hypothetical protein
MADKPIRRPASLSIRPLFAYNRGVPKRRCLVLIPDPHGGNHDYDLEAESSMEAARIVLNAT